MSSLVFFLYCFIFPVNVFINFSKYVIISIEPLYLHGVGSCKGVNGSKDRGHMTSISTVDVIPPPVLYIATFVFLKFNKIDIVCSSFKALER